MIEQEIEQEKQLNMIDDTSGETSPYKELIVNPYHTKGYSQLVANHAKHNYSHDQSKCSTMPSATIAA